MTKLFTSRDLAINERMWRPKKFGRKTFQTKIMVKDCGDGHYLVVVFFFRKQPLDTVTVWHGSGDTTNPIWELKYQVSTRSTLEGRRAEEMYVNKKEQGYVCYSQEAFRKLLGVKFVARFRR